MGSEKDVYLKLFAYLFFRVIFLSSSYLVNPTSSLFASMYYVMPHTCIGLVFSSDLLQVTMMYWLLYCWFFSHLSLSLDHVMPVCKNVVT